MSRSLLAARPGKDDARQVFYAVTAKGTQRLAKAMPLWQGAHQQSLAMLGAQAASAERKLARRRRRAAVTGPLHRPH